MRLCDCVIVRACVFMYVRWRESVCMWGGCLLIKMTTQNNIWMIVVLWRSNYEDGAAVEGRMLTFAAVKYSPTIGPCTASIKQATFWNSLKYLDAFSEAIEAFRK